MKQFLPQQFFEIFKGRTDRAGIGGNAASSIAVHSETEILDLVQQHLDGKTRIGFYNLLPDGTCPWAVVDFDDHEKAGDLKDSDERSKAFMEHMRSAGISCYREKSSNPNGRCFHVWMKFEKPLSAKKVHLALKSFVNRAMGIDIEVFPKGYDPTKLGNFVWLPEFGGEDNLGLGVPAGRTVFVNEKGKSFPDQEKILAGIIPTTEDQFDKFIAAYKLSVDRKTYNLREAALLDGLEKLRQCPFMKYCEDNAANLPEPLWYAWITNAARVKGGRVYIHEWSKKYPNYSQIETDKKIAHGLADTGPMTYEAIQGAGWHSQYEAGLKAPLSMVYRVDVDAEIKRIKEIPDGPGRTAEIKKFLKSLSRVSAFDLDRAKKLAKSELGISAPLFDQETKKIDVSEIGRDEPLPEILAKMKAVKHTPEKCAEIIYEWMKENGVEFFRDKLDNTYTLFDKRLEEITMENRNFRRYFYRVTGYSLAGRDGWTYIDVLQHLAYDNGKLIEPSTWEFTDKENFTVYFNPNVPERQLLQISPDGIKVVDQADNEKSVVLQDSPKIRPIKFRQLTEKEYQEALRKLKILVVDNMACLPVNRLFCTAWMIGMMLVDFVHMRPILRFEGITSSGKSFASDLFSYLLYGASEKKIATTASNFSDAAQNPVLILDNVEMKNMGQELIDFLLVASVGTSKEKRKAGTDTANVLEKAQCLILTNGIESFSHHEIINRTYIVDFDIEKHGAGVVGVSSDIFGEIVASRNEILSAQFMIIAKILARLKKGDRKNIIAELQKRYKGHAKRRSDEFFAMMIMIAEELLKAWGDKRNVWDLVDEWIKGQNAVAKQTHAGANVIIAAIDVLRIKAERHFANGGAMAPENWNHEVQLEKSESVSGVVLKGWASDFHSSLKAVAGNAGYDLKNAQQFGRRFADARKILEDGGYIVNVTEQADRYSYTFEYDPAAKKTGTETITTPVPAPAPEPKNADNANKKTKKAAKKEPRNRKKKK